MKKILLFIFSFFMLTKVSMAISASSYIVYDMDNKLLYNCNQYFFFNRKLAKELQRIIDEDEFIDDSGNRIIFR